MTLGADFVSRTERLTMQVEQKNNNMCKMFKGFDYLWSVTFLSDDVLVAFIRSNTEKSYDDVNERAI